MTYPFLRYLLLLAVGLFACSIAQAQQDTSRFRRNGFAAESIFADSGKLTSGDYMMHIEDAYQAFNHVMGMGKLRHEIYELKDQLNDSDSALRVVGRVVNTVGNTLDVRNLQMFSILLKNVQADILESEQEITAAGKEMEVLKEELRKLMRDTTLRKLVRDSVARLPFLEQLRGLRSKRRGADSVLKASLTYINQLKMQTSALQITCSELSNKVEERLRMTGIKSFSKEVPFLWESGKAAKAAAAIKARTSATQTGDEKKALSYYLKEVGGKRLLLLLFGAFFFWWITYNLRVIRKNGMAHTLKHYHIYYLAMQPIAAAFVLMFSIAPLFDMNAPAAYVESMQFFLLIALTFIFYRQWPRPLFKTWLSVVVLFVLFAWVGHTTTPTLLRRYTFIVLCGASIAAWLVFLKRLPEQTALKRFIKTALVINLLLNALAILFNAYGRVTLSHVFATTAIFSFTQALGLSACFTVLTEGILLQVHGSRVRQGIQKGFDGAVVTAGFQKPLMAMTVLVWMIGFTTNMNMYAPLSQGIGRFLATTRSIGSVTFSFGSVVLFFLIIMLAHMLQRYIGYFMGAVDDEEEEGAKGQRSRLLITKLVLITAGYLLAVAASGLPVDKITIVLGALGVGIGMGLQNIVNNFVSGIILIFDRPLQIGDSVDIGTKSGKVKEIGLRSSTLFTADGAEVIIPNGDILSQQITNWTFSNNYKRLDLSLTIAGTDDKERLEKLIADAVTTSPFTLQQKTPVVLFEKMKSGEMSLKVYFWCAEVQKAELAKSSAHFLLYQAVSAQGLELK
ncbi:small-conductance mechanosensitive channel [Filimonas zeae]|uniref:Mechanosensitive ion channel MscS domain-containing protein n=1 Tax=Filimonas zeae TaxID=1737353 RepID=A0A917MYI9_9BACT|nr:mechanosensitive ion channel domain-containing protein [Filimonas zeae]MDR6341924.1 small-conductance mechanosensitive channel [Filimonas zeae]GGH79802.1 hypothetical protein GCM10011379_49720 [Filimonas zeae]